MKRGDGSREGGLVRREEGETQRGEGRRKIMDEEGAAKSRNTEGF